MNESQIIDLIAHHEQEIKFLEEDLENTRDAMAFRLKEIKSLEKQLKNKQTKGLFTNCGEDESD
tara:strand:+ start:230 stop:421 length:192 start_codon:yes stop_codon:yes gene_type:complete